MTDTQETGKAAEPVDSPSPAQPEKDSSRAYENMIMVDFGGGAGGAISRGELEWRLRYGANSDVVAAGVISNFDYLINHCTQKEQVRRLALMKKARLSHD